MSQAVTSAPMSLPLLPAGNQGWFSITGGWSTVAQTSQTCAASILYDDYVADSVSGLRYDGVSGYSEARAFSPTVNNLSSFGYDESYEAYALDRSNGRLYKIVAP